MKGRPSAWRVRFEVPAQLGAVGAARRTLNTFLKERGLRLAWLRKLGLVVTEALNNAIENRRTGDRGPVELELRLERAGIWIAVRGSAGKNGGLRLRRALAGAELHEMEEERGRGLFLMKSIMDKVGVRSLPGGRTELWMRKSISS